jgi:phospholipid transport system substrate-binding protein
MKIKSFLQLIILFFGIFCYSADNAAALTPVQAKSWAEQKGEQILQILSAPSSAQKYAELDTILAQDIDLDHAAKFVVGKYWRQMTPEQQAEYVPLFKRYVSALYKSVPLDIKTDSIRFQIDKTAQTSAGTEVWCTIFAPQIEEMADEKSQGGIKVLFILTDANGHVQVRDLKVEESSLLLSYRDRFYKMIHEDSDDDMTWFLEDLTTVTQDTEEKNAQKLDLL